MKFQDLSGKKFNMWTVIKRVHIKPKTTHYECICDCGNIKNVSSSHLKNGASFCCGCFRKPEKCKYGGITKGPQKTWPKKYKTWRYIMDRTVNPNRINRKDYIWYKDVYFYEPWKDYKNFDKDVPDPSDDNLTIDRIDNTKGYEPGNLRWVIMAEQHRNQSNCHWIEFNGEKLLLTDWAKRLNITGSSLNRRLKNGWSLEKALTTCKKIR